MPIRSLIPAVLGTVAILTTTAVLVIHIVLAQSITDAASPVRNTAIVAAALEAVVLVAISWLSYSALAWWSRGTRPRSFNGIWFGVGLFLCTVAAAVSVSTLVCLSNAAGNLPSRILGSSTTGFLVGSSVALGLSFAMQVMCLVFRFVMSRMESYNGAHSIHTESDRNRSPLQHHVKSIPYHQTSPSTLKRGSMSMRSRSPPGSSGGRSRAETMSSIRSSLSQVVRPISSRTRLLPGSQRSSRRPASLESNVFRDPQPSMTEDGFDSWDTSAVDPQNRQTVLETSPQAPRFLETIPASPTTSRSPSPGTPLDLEPPRTSRRSRSYSPAGTRRVQAQRAASFTQHATQSETHIESHIHPLFRSDSPTPPPIATPGTVVVAAPNGGQVLSDRHSIRSLTRMRSGSLPVVPSPLSRQGSFDSFHQRRVDSTSPELREEDENSGEVHENLGVVHETERKMTPPIPDWILSAGSRTSLSGYNSRKIRTPVEGEMPPPL